MPPKKPGRKKGAAPAAKPPPAQRVLRSSRKTPLPTVPEDPPAEPDPVPEDFAVASAPVVETAANPKDERVRTRFATAEDIFDFSSKEFDVGYDQIDPNRVADFPVKPRPPLTPKTTARALPACHPSPLKADPSSLLMSSHTLESIHPYVYRDLKDSTIVPLFDWVEMFLGRDLATIHRWSIIIEEQKWFQDSVIQEALILYCEAREERKRYQPFVNFGNRILSLARANLPQFASETSFPIANLCFADSSSHEVKTIPEHGKLGAKRRPDVIMVRENRAEVLKKKGGGVEWSDIFFWWELKGNTPLTEVLDNEREKAGMLTVAGQAAADRALLINADAIHKAAAKANTDIDRETCGSGKEPEVVDAPEADHEREATDERGIVPPRFRTGSGEDSSEELADKVSSTHPDLSSSDVRAGVKRKLETREPDDAMDGMQVRSSVLARNSRGTEADLVRGRQGAAQSTSYALEANSCTRGTRVFSLASVLKEDRLFFWRYGPNGIMYTTTYLSIIVDFPLVAAIIIAIALLTPEQFGAMPASVLTPSDTSYDNYPLTNLNGCTVHMQNQETEQPVLITLEENIFTQYSLMGRRTFLYKAVADPPILSAENVIVKFSYQHATRVPEPELLEDALRAGVNPDHLPEIHLWQDLWTLEDVQREAFRLRQRSQASEFEPVGLKEPQYEDRVLRAIVYTEYLPIKTLFTEFPELIPVMVDQIIDCLHELRYKARILHRDISVNNIMWTIKDGKLLFKLIDFDNAARLPDETKGGAQYTPTAKTRSGTLPFMANELIRDAHCAMQRISYTPIDHFLRHDYESLFYVSLWCAEVLFVDSAEPAHAKVLIDAAKSLESGVLSTLSLHKKAIIYGGLDQAMPGVSLPRPAQRLVRWFSAWTKVLIRSFSVLDDYRQDLILEDSEAEDDDDIRPIDLETADGNFTRDILKEALSKRIPTQHWTIEQLQEKYCIRSEPTLAMQPKVLENPPPEPAAAKAVRKPRARPKAKAAPQAEPTVKPRSETAAKAKDRVKRTKKQQQVTVAVSSMLSRLRPRKKPAGRSS